MRREVGEETTAHDDSGNRAGKTGIKRTGGLERYGPKALAPEAKEDLDTRPVQASRKPAPRKHHQTQQAVGILWMCQPGKEEPRLVPKLTTRRI